jgi:hypothetical protein
MGFIEVITWREFREICGDKALKLRVTKLASLLRQIVLYNDDSLKMVAYSGGNPGRVIKQSGQLPALLQ